MTGAEAATERSHRLESKQDRSLRDDAAESIACAVEQSVTIALASGMTSTSQPQPVLFPQLEHV
jgi:hypothetical protein